MAISKELIHPCDEETFFVKNFPAGKAIIQDSLSLMLVYGTNTACDILLKEIKEQEEVQQYIVRLELKIWLLQIQRGKYKRMPP